jgi:hypothetical protein
MSHLPTTPTPNPFYAKISIKNGVNNHAKRAKGAKHGKESLRGAGYQSVGVSQQARCYHGGHCTMEFKRNSQYGKKSFRIYAEGSQARTAVKNCEGVSQSVTRYKQYLVNLCNSLSIISFLSNFTNNLLYNPLIPLGVKGFHMEQIKIDLRKTITSDNIEMNLERKLKGFIFLLDSLEVSIEAGNSNSMEGFALMSEMVKNLIDDDIKTLKEHTNYMFDVCSRVYHGNGGASC